MIKFYCFSDLNWFSLLLLQFIQIHGPASKCFHSAASFHPLDMLCHLASSCWFMPTHFFPPAMSTGLQFLVSGLKFLLVSLQCWLLDCFNFIGLAPLQLQFHWSTSTVISTFIALFWLHSFPLSCFQFCLDWILDSCDFQLVSGFTCPLASELVQFPFTSLDSPLQS